MTTRDRLFAVVIAAAAILAAFWFLLVVPERKQAASLNEQVTVARQSLNSAQEKLNGARAAQAQYNSAYSSIVRMGEAVPPTAEVPSLVYQIDQLSNSKHVSFNSITASSGGAASAPSSSSSSATAASSSAAFSELPFTFAFSGSFFDLYNLFNQLDGLAVQTAGGQVKISGRLLTIQSVNLTLGGEGSTSASASKGSEAQLTGTVTATAYALPAGQGLTAGATPAGPAGVSATTPQPASTSSSSASTSSSSSTSSSTPSTPAT